MLARLQGMCEHAIGEGLLTGETAAEVDAWSINVSGLTLPHRPSDSDHSGRNASSNV